MKYDAKMRLKPLIKNCWLLFVLMVMVAKVQAQAVLSGEVFRGDISFLASDAMDGRLTGTIYQKIAAEYIKSRMIQNGLSKLPEQTDFLQSFYIRQQQDPHSTAGSMSQGTDSVQVINVCGFIDNKAAKTIIVGAHYDHLGEGGNSFSLSTEKAVHNGADDNSSGVSIMLELSNLLSKSSATYNYLFIAFSGEEFGLWGSNYFVKHPIYPLEKIAAMINLDMVGRLKEDKTLLVGGVGTSPVWKGLLEQSNTAHLKMVYDESGVGPSDHTSFYYANIPVLFYFTGQHSDYHKPSDDIDKINFEGMAAITTNIYTLITDLNKIDNIPFTKTKDPEETKTDFKVTLGIMPDYIYADGGLRVDGVKEDRPGFKAGLKQGDIIYHLAKVEVTDIQSYMKALNSISPGQKVPIRYKRGNEMIDAAVQF
ncbi:MAG TPA: M28 family peptidase [Saprospiraceae bacterium]|nr:M28 family peptidase [Saprospiraceae bacterium]